MTDENSQVFSGGYAAQEGENRQEGYAQGVYDHRGTSEVQEDGGYYGEVLVRMKIGQFYDDVHGYFENPESDELDY